MIRIVQPSSLELQALSVLWHEGPSTVATVLEQLTDGKELAYTTVLSVLQSLERKGHVKKVKQGRAHVYEASHTQNAVVRDTVAEFVMNTFRGRKDKAILAILSTGKLTPEEKNNIERELKQQTIMAAKKAPAKKAAKKAPAKKAAKKAAKK